MSDGAALIRLTRHKSAKNKGGVLLKANFQRYLQNCTKLNYAKANSPEQNIPIKTSLTNAMEC